MSNNEYYIHVQAELVETGDTSAPSNKSATPDQTTKKLTKEAGDKAGSGSVSKVIAIQMGKKALNYGIQNYANLTGDYIGQANIGSIIEIASLAAMAAAGPVGIASAVASVTVKSVSYGIDMAKKRREVEFLRERTGMIGMNGGRLR